MTRIDVPVLIGVIWKLGLGERTISKTGNDTKFMGDIG